MGKKKLEVLKSVVCGVAIVYGLFSVGVITYGLRENSKHLDSLQLAYESEYIYYLDGVEVNPDLLDVSFYKSSVDSEAGCVYLTNK